MIDESQAVPDKDGAQGSNMMSGPDGGKTFDDPPVAGEDSTVRKDEDASGQPGGEATGGKDDNGQSAFGQAAWSDFCWGILFHMLGLDALATQCLGAESDDTSPSQEVARARNDLAAVVRAFDSGSKGEARDHSFLEVLSTTGTILGPWGKDDPSHEWGTSPRLCRECDRGDKGRKAQDAVHEGYSRDPFKEIEEKHKPDIAIAAVVYLLRAHCYFFGRNPSSRDFNAAKVALNDLFQASQLACRLYYSLDVCHRETGSQKKYLESVREGWKKGIAPWNSAYCIWSALELVEIQRGNVYRQVQYLDEAERYYRHAQRRFEHLKERIRDSSSTSISAVLRTWFITPTLIRALYERSKVLFDIGLFLDSMLNQLRCLGYLVELASTDNDRNGAKENLLGDIDKTIQFLEVCRRQSVWDKERISVLFQEQLYQDQKEPAWLKTRLTPGRFVPFLLDEAPRTRELAAELFARLGFTLLMFQRKWLPVSPTALDPASHANEVDTLKKNLRPFFTIHSDLTGEAEKEGGLRVVQPAIARYCESIVNIDEQSVKAHGTADNPLHETIERELAERLREAVVGDRRTHKDGRGAPAQKGEEPPDHGAEGDYHGRYAWNALNESGFYTAILDQATQNVDNIVTIPRRIQSFLIRPGAIWQRRDGPLKERTMCEAYKRSRERPRVAGREEQKGPAHDGTVRNKFVVLRRWQSFNPRVPRPDAGRVRGGGYYLQWYEKGIVIDPGYDFIQNFYDEGFSLADINAVIVTHSHPDHDDDLSTLTTLVREWNEFKQHFGEGEQRRLDLFLNESTHMKFAAWLKASLKASPAGIGRIVPLPLVVWNDDSSKQYEELRGGNTRLDLRTKYRLELEVVPAWHDDVIGKTASIGLKLHLYDRANGGSLVGVVGYTGDTGAYDSARSNQEKPGVEIGSTHSGQSPSAQAPKKDGPRSSDGKQAGEPLVIENEYRDCDVLIAHLGDIRLSELFTVIDSKPKRGRDDPIQSVRRPADSVLGQVLRDWFSDDDGKVSKAKLEKDRVEAFFRMLVTFKLVPEKALSAVLPEPMGEITFLKALQNYFNEEPVLGKGKWTVKAISDSLSNSGYFGPLLRFDTASSRERNYKLKRQRAISGQIWDHVFEASEAQNEGTNRSEEAEMADWQIVYALLGFLTACALEDWTYEYHLGISGLYRLHRAMVTYSDKNSRERETDAKRNRIFVVSELPEELASYRHWVARFLNITSDRAEAQKDGKNVYSFTGDIGLHIGLAPHGGDDSRVKPSSGVGLDPKIRCAYCNYNNETVLHRYNYHTPDKILETPLRRLDSAMIYLCTTHDHHPENEEMPSDFLSRPNLRVI